MAKLLNSKYGKVHKLKNNPRKISDGQFTKLCESLSFEQDIDFLDLRGIVVWYVPDDIQERHPDSLFASQAGLMVVLGGNQRYSALMALGYDRIPDKWLVEAKHPDGSWYSPDEAERFVLKDNNPDGLSGENDYDKMLEHFNQEWMKAAGIDFSNFPVEKQEEFAKPVEDEIEEGEHGEDEPELEKFKQKREASRSLVPEMMDVGFYSVVVFETYAQKMQFVNWLLDHDVTVNREIFVNGFHLAKQLGIEIKPSGLHFPDPKPVKELQDLAMDGTQDGYEVRVEDIEEGVIMSDEDEKDVGAGDDNVGV